MGTTLNKEEKIQKLTELVERYVQHLKLWDKVKVTVFTRDHAFIPYTELVEDAYGGKSEVLRHNKVKTPPSPYVTVTYYQPTEEWKDRLYEDDFESKVFPLCDIDRRIAHYKYKLKTLEEKTS